MAAATAATTFKLVLVGDGGTGKVSNISFAKDALVVILSRAVGCGDNITDRFQSSALG